MIKSELVERVAKITGVTKTDTKMMVNAILEEISKELDSGSDVKLSGFGSFRVSTIAAHEGYNPTGGDPLQYPDQKRVRFKPAKELRERVNKNV